MTMPIPMPRTLTDRATLAVACAALILPITWLALSRTPDQGRVVHAIGLALGLALASAGLRAVGLGPLLVRERTGSVVSPFNPIRLVMTFIGGSLAALGFSLGIAALLESLV